MNLWKWRIGNLCAPSPNRPTRNRFRGMTNADSAYRGAAEILDKEKVINTPEAVRFRLSMNTFP